MKNINVISCSNFRQELTSSIASSNVKTFYHNPVCLDNSNQKSDEIQKIITNNDLDESHLFLCDVCSQTYKNRKNHQGTIQTYGLCFDKVLHPNLVRHYTSKGYYLVTPGWLDNWEKYVKEIWGFNAENAKLFFEESYVKVLLLDTMGDIQTQKALIEFSSFIGKEYETLPVGRDFYNTQINGFLDNYALEKELKESKDKYTETQSKLLNFTLGLELVKSLSDIVHESDIIDKIFNVLRMMFMPNDLRFIRFEGQKQIDTEEEFDGVVKNLITNFEHFKYSPIWINGDKGFASTISFNKELLGILIINDIQFQEFKKLYYNSFVQIKDIFAISIYNARLFDNMTKQKLENEKQRLYFEQLFSNSPEMILITNSDVKITSINNSFMNFLQIDSMEVLDLTFKEFCEKILYIQDAESKEIFSQSIKQVSVHLRQKDHVFEVVHYPIQFYGETIGYYIIFEDVTERITTENKMRQLAFHDGLTGLYNRAFCEEEMIRLVKNRQLPMGIIIGDVNGLKITNDAFGHQMGDRLLQNVAYILKDNCREGDIIARWGGDEFIILLPHIEEKSLKRIVERIIYACDHYESKDFIHISISLGFSMQKKEHGTLTQSFIRAENMMYDNKLLRRDSVRSKIVKSLEMSLFEKSYETEEHAVRVSEISFQLGKLLELSPGRLNNLKILGRLHDIGKLVIDDNILSKPGKLTKQEIQIIKTHPESGYRIAKSIKELSHIAEFILYHHEKWDGTGYPSGKKGNQIPLESRIVCLADSVDAMLSERPYKNAMSLEQVLIELVECSGKQFDPDLVDIYIQLINQERA